MSTVSTSDVRRYLLGLQGQIVSALSAQDGQSFIRDEWARPPGGKLQGDGISRLIEGGAVFERGGVGFSHVKGPSNMVATGTQDQQLDRQGQSYFLVGDGAIVNTPTYGATYVFAGDEGLRTAEIGVTIGWNDDNTLNKVPVGGINYPQHTLTFITAMPQPGSP